MFDIHYHLIYGVDDGPKEFEDAVALAEASIAEGVTHIVATPHSNDQYTFDPQVNRERLAQIQERVGDRITLGLGCDFHLSYDNIESLHKDPARYTINGKQYLLVEFPDFGIQQNMGSIFYNMTVAGIVPIITHPERNQTILKEPERMAEWLRLGCLVQVTASSLTGRFGQRSQAMAAEFMRKNWVHMIASDAHSVERRSPAMSRAYAALETEYGKDVADRLCVENPRAIYFGEKLPAQPGMLGLFEEEKPVKQGFFRKLFGG